jgi:hypothetical protein
MWSHCRSWVSFLKQLCCSAYISEICWTHKIWHVSFAHLSLHPSLQTICSTSESPSPIALTIIMIIHTTLQTLRHKPQIVNIYPLTRSTSNSLNLIEFLWRFTCGPARKQVSLECGNEHKCLGAQNMLCVSSYPSRSSSSLAPCRILKTNCCSPWDDICCTLTQSQSS